MQGESGDPGRFELFRHGSDIGVRGFGSTKERAFEQAALALTSVVANPVLVKPQRLVEVSCEAPDQELLLIDWLNAIVYEMDRRRMLFGRYAVSLEGGQLRGRAFGETVDVGRHSPAVEVKGATFTELAVERQTSGEWLAQCVVDV
jgi:SHS2 domain-containing protein